VGQAFSLTLQASCSRLSDCGLEARATGWKPAPLIWLGVETVAEAKEDAVGRGRGGKFSERCGLVSMLVTWLI
jgi:hypothetical protein